ncbi:MAG: AAA family ATPase [Synergistaceae bacterium]|nr:AAA family ATPase [Synergistaceae bacterium]
MQELPIGIQDFEMLRRDNLLYVDKTARLLELIKNGRRYFLSRPRRFGKSLTLSTLEAMFSGRVELFNVLFAVSWVQERSKNPLPVLRFDISACETGTVSLFKQSLKEMLSRFARRFNVDFHSKTISGMFQDLIEGVYKSKGYIVLLIDEYDKPILDNIGNIKKAEKLRSELRSFYSVLKSFDYFRFIFLTGISKFSKVGVFSVLNNLLDISLSGQYGDITGYTQEELEGNFVEWIDLTASKMGMSRSEILERLRDYYDGFSFNGDTRLYNPFSILSFFAMGEFNNYWYESGSPSFIVEWMKRHKIQEPEDYRHKVVMNNFVNSEEIERADPSSFLFQSGYLTIEKKQDRLLTLDYPNREVLDSISTMYLKLVYKVEGYAMLGNEIWKALREGDISEVVNLYNVALGGIAYDDYSKNRNEFWYRSMLVMLLRGAGIISYSEPHTSLGRADVVINFQDKIIVLEFKFAKHNSDVEKMKREGEQQIQERHYAQSYAKSNREIITAVIVADGEKRQVVL